MSLVLNEMLYCRKLIFGRIRSRPVLLPDDGESTGDFVVMEFSTEADV